jgi:predicted enzyme related to lactoylglutathione lyase
MYNFAHVELPAMNVDREAKFYAELFQWKLQHFYGDEYRMIVTPDGREIGGLTKVENIHYQEDYVVYVEVESVEATLTLAEKLGGKKVGERRELPGDYGFYSKIKTPDGYCIGIWARR